MKNFTSILVLGVFLASCSAPKYSYHFDKYDYNSGKKTEVATSTIGEGNREVETSPVILHEQEMVASAGSATPSISVEQKQMIAKKISSMSKSERKELKETLNEIKKSFRKKTFEGDSLHEKKAWDYDLKMAAIFGAVGLVLTALGGVNTVFWVLGAIALIVGVVFLIKWLSRQ
jgi:hypothetical protein